MISPLILWMSVAIVASTVRQAFYGPLTKRETRAAYVLTVVSLATVSLTCVSTMMDGKSAPTSRPLALALAAGVAIVLAVTRRGRIPSHVHAHVAMLLSWGPNTVLWLIASAPTDDWDVGALLAIVACVAYAAEAAVRLTLAASRGKRNGHGSVVDAGSDGLVRAATGER